MSIVNRMSIEDYRKATAADKPGKRHKYGAKRTEVNGIVFDSKAESRRYQELRLDPDITGLELQKKFDLLVAGEKIGSYIADFVYFDRKKQCTVVEDVKGVRTPVYRLKKKIFEALYAPLKITET